MFVKEKWLKLLFVVVFSIKCLDEKIKAERNFLIKDFKKKFNWFKNENRGIKNYSQYFLNNLRINRAIDNYCKELKIDKIKLGITIINWYKQNINTDLKLLDFYFLYLVDAFLGYSTKGKTTIENLNTYNSMFLNIDENRLIRKDLSFKKSWLLDVKELFQRVNHYKKLIYENINLTLNFLIHTNELSCTKIGLQNITRKLEDVITIYNYYFEKILLLYNKPGQISLRKFDSYYICHYIKLIIAFFKDENSTNLEILDLDISLLKSLHNLIFNIYSNQTYIIDFPFKKPENQNKKMDKNTFFNLKKNSGDIKNLYDILIESCRDIGMKEEDFGIKKEDFDRIITNNIIMPEWNNLFN